MHVIFAWLDNFIELGFFTKFLSFFAYSQLCMAHADLSVAKKTSNKKVSFVDEYYSNVTFVLLDLVVSSSTYLNWVIFLCSEKKSQFSHDSLQDSRQFPLCLFLMEIQLQFQKFSPDQFHIFL